MSNVSQQELEKILKGVKIPPQPQVLVELDNEQSKKSPNLNRISELISRDVGLSAAVLKTINSPFYGMPNKIDSVRRSVFLLGSTTVINLVRGAVLRSAFDGDGVLLERFWETAADVANISMYLAQHFSFANPEENYTLGLFHDCGIAVMTKQYRDYKDVLKTANNGLMRNVTEVEDNHYKTNHAVLGYYLCKSWHLSETLCQVVLEHHDLDNLIAAGVENISRNETMAVLKMSNNISHTYRRLSEDHEWEVIRGQVLEQLALGANDYEGLKDDIHDMMRNIA